MSTTLIHYITDFNDDTGPDFACADSNGDGSNSPGRVTCFACRQSSVFKNAQARTDVRTSVPSGVIASIRAVIREYDNGIHSAADALSIIRSIIEGTQ